MKAKKASKGKVSYPRIGTKPAEQGGIDRQKGGNMKKVFAETAWAVADILALKPKWTRQQATEFLQRHEGHIEQAMIREGWHVIQAMLPHDMTEERDIPTGDYYLRTTKRKRKTNCVEADELLGDFMLSLRHQDKEAKAKIEYRK